MTRPRAGMRITRPSAPGQVRHAPRRSPMTATPAPVVHLCVVAGAALLLANPVRRGGPASPEADAHVQDRRRPQDPGRRLPGGRHEGAAGGRLDSRRGADHGEPQVGPAEPARPLPRRGVRPRLPRLPARPGGEAAGDHRGRGGRLPLAPRRRREGLPPRPGPGRRDRRLGRRLPDADDRRGGEAPADGAGRLLGLRRRGRRLVHQAVRVLPQAGPADRQGRGVQGGRRAR